MDIKELRQKKHELSTQALALVDAAGDREFTSAEQANYNSLKVALAKLEGAIVREEERMELERTAAGLAFDRSQGDVAVSGGFDSHVEFLSAVMRAGRNPAAVDDRLMQYRAAAGSDEQGSYSDPYGGFLVPTSMLPGVLAIGAEDDPLLGLVTPVPMRTPEVHVNARVDKNHATSVSGGLVVTRSPETVAKNASRMEFEQVTLHAHGEFGLAFASEEILQDSPESFLALLSAGFGDEFVSNRMNERLNGSGTGEFRGVLEAPCTIAVAAEPGQDAATIVKENIDKMAARAWKYPRCVWLANPTTRPQLKSLVQVIGTAGDRVPYFTTDNRGQERLDGRPIFFTEHSKTLGTKGDLILGNWSQYLEGEYQPMRSAQSTHVRYVEHERAFKFWKRNDGQPWWRSALTPKNGDTLSPFVVLADRL